MALPTTISGVLLPNSGQPFFFGPFISGGNIYAVFEDSTTAGLLNVVKATDPTASFATQDASNAPDAGTTIVSLWAFQDGTDLKIVTATATGPEYRYHVFHMATDLWDGTLKNETIEDVKDQPPICAVSCAVRSDGDVIVLYNGDMDAVMGADWRRVDYARREPSWTVGVNVAGDSLESSWVSGATIRGASDKMHFLYMDSTNADAYQRSLSSANSLGTQHTLDTTVAALGGQVFIPAVYYDDAGIERITIAYHDSDSTLQALVVENDGTPGTPSNLSDAAVGQSRGCLAVENGTIKKVHALFPDSGTSDLFYDVNQDEAGWGTDVEILDAVTVSKLSCTVYDRSGTKLAYVYNDGGTVKYNEKSLSSDQSFGLSGVLATG